LEKFSCFLRFHGHCAVYDFQSISVPIPDLESVPLKIQLTKEETINLRSHFATSSWGGVRKLPYAFTQEGVAMLSSVLNSERAIKVNIQIMRAFVKLKELLLTHKDLAIKIDALEGKYDDHDQKIKAIFEAIKKLLEPPPAKDRIITGFRTPDKVK
jgi:hypothetical protein